jgi:hypothetical protein
MIYTYFYVRKKKNGGLELQKTESTWRSISVIFKVKFICGIQNGEAILIDPGYDTV